MTQLGLAGPELSEGLSDRHALDTTLEERIEHLTASGNASHALAPLHDLHASLEARRLDLLRDFVALVSLSFRDALDVEHLFLGAIGHK